MTSWYLGIDGGQTSTTAVVVDDEGTIAGRGTAGPSDHVDEPSTSERAALACETAARAALDAAGATPETRVAAAVIGLSGFEGAWHGREPRLNAGAVRYLHDARIALAGAIAERPAAVVIAGTGSVGYGERATGEAVRVGGYGYLFGDEGSAFWIARSALAGAMRMNDRGVMTDLGAAARAFFDEPDLAAIARGVALRRISRPQLASFSRVVFDAARLGDEQARTIVLDAAAALTGIATLIVERLGGSETSPVPVAFVGGVTANALLRAEIERRLAEAVPAARTVVALGEPAYGAALIALTEGAAESTV